MGKGSHQRRRAQRSGDGSAPAKSKFTAPTPGLEDVIFAHGTVWDAAVFEEVVKKITRYLGTQPWKEVSVLIRAIEQLEEPAIPKPDEPKREYWTDSSKTAKTEEVTSPDGGSCRRWNWIKSSPPGSRCTSRTGRPGRRNRPPGRRTGRGRITSSSSTVLTPSWRNSRRREPTRRYLPTTA